MIMKGRAISPGKASGKAIVYPEAFSFLGGVDGSTGRFNVMDGDITGKVFVFPNGKGSTVGSYVVYDLMVHGHAPAALVNRSAETIVTTGAVISSVPMVDEVDISLIRNGDDVVVDGDAGTVEIVNARETKSVTSMVVCGGKMLVLTRRADAHSFPGKKSLVSGRLEDGESLREAAVREIKEETGLSVTFRDEMPDIRVREGDTVWCVRPFLFEASSSDVVLDPENAGFEWVPIGDFDAADAVEGTDAVVAYFRKKLVPYRFEWKGVTERFRSE